MNREEILAAAQRQLNVNPRSSLSDVAAAAGIGRATLHRHFSSRESLLDEIGTRSLDRWEQRLDEVEVERVAAAGDREEVERTLRAMIAAFVEDADDFGFSLTDFSTTQEPAQVERIELLFAREVQLYVAAQATGVLRDDVPARWLGHAAYGLLVAAREAIRAGDVARREVPDLVISTYLEGGQPR